MPPKDDENEPGMTEILHLLSTRRSVPPVSLTGPGPNADELATLLKIAARVPDHGKLAPWRFIVFQGEARARAGAIVAEGFKRREPQADETRIAAEAKRMTMAPLIIGVVSTAKEGAKVPAWEQELSAGAVCMNILLAAKGLGFDGSWLTNWFSYDHDVLAQLGVQEGERMAGFIHLGRAAQVPEDRPRPDLAQIVSYF
jgi:nitroreductase